MRLAVESWLQELGVASEVDACGADTDRHRVWRERGGGQSGHDSQMAAWRERGGMGSNTIGEASFVELAPGKYLFALLGNELDRALTTFLPDIVNTEEKATRFETLRETRGVPRDRYPLLVTFADISDPRTVQKVDPDNLATSFGRGVTLERITLTITDERLSVGKILELLPWITWPHRKFLTAGGGETPLKIPGATVELLAL